MKEIYEKIKYLTDRTQISTYGCVGLISTIVTIITTLVLTSLSVYLYLSNLIGYVAGFLINFILNSKLTFKKKPSLIRLIKFTVSCTISYIVNLSVIYSILIGDESYIFISQAIGMASYTLTNYIINKKWVML